MTFAFAKRCADRMVERLFPFCDRIEIAGSVRRQRPECGDVDLVAIPTRRAEQDLFGNPTGSKNLLAEEIRRLCGEHGWEFGTDGEEFASIQTRGVQVDLWYAEADTFASVFLQRTGSKEHNIWLCMEALAKGGKWVPNRGLFLHGRLVKTVAEFEIYSALGLPFLDPVADRDHPFFRKFASIKR